jgi:hypothetical protein
MQRPGACLLFRNKSNTNDLIFYLEKPDLVLLRVQTYLEIQKNKEVKSHAAMKIK